MDKAWSDAIPIEVIATGNTEPDRVVAIEVRSVHTNREIAFLFRWADETKTDTYRKYIWFEDASKPDLVGGPDDQIALKFNMSGPVLSCMLAGRVYMDDVWHWKAARTNPAGYAQDRRFVIERVEAATIDAPGHYVAHNGTSVRVTWLEDAGRPLVNEVSAPPLENNGPAETFELGEPSGSQADIGAKGVWEAGYWTVEMSRRFDTGHHVDDAVIDPGRTSKFAVAVFDASEGQVHANTRFIKLKIE